MATLSMAWYGRGVDAVSRNEVNLLSDTIRVAVLTNSYTPNQGGDQFWSEISVNEASGSGYVAGGQTLANKSLVYDPVERRVTFDGDNVVWDPATLSGRYVVLYQDTGISTTSRLIGYGDAGAVQSSENAQFSVEWNVDGILRKTASAIT